MNLGTSSNRSFAAFISFLEGHQEGSADAAALPAAKRPRVEGYESGGGGDRGDGAIARGLSALRNGLDELERATHAAAGAGLSIEQRAELKRHGDRVLAFVDSFDMSFE